MLPLKSLCNLKCIRSPETKFVHGDGKVSRLVVAVVEVAVVHWDQVHIAKDEAVVLCVLQSLRVADIQQLGTVESVLTQLQENTQERSLFHCLDIQMRRTMLSC